MPITIINDAAFDPETTQAMVKAFELACGAMPTEAMTAKQLLARRIIKAAETGERDPAKLCAMAVNFMKSVGA